MASENAVEVFFSYSHKDETLRDQLASHLIILERQGIIASWHDRKILPGSEWAGDIKYSLKQADIILLLVSADFLASDYCWNHEMQEALARHEAGEATVIPVILRPVDWSSAPFARLQALPKDAKPVVEWIPPDRAFMDIAAGIRRKAKELVKARRDQEARARKQAAQKEYRQKVKEYLVPGAISSVAQEVLKTLAESSGLDPAEAELIKTEETTLRNAYLAKLDRYSQIFRQALDEDSWPIPNDTRRHLQDYQNHLKLLKQDVQQTEQAVLAEWQAERHRKQEQEAADRRCQEQAEAERIQQQQIEAERREREHQAEEQRRQEQEAADRRRQEQAEAERIQQQQIETERREREHQAEEQQRQEQEVAEVAEHHRQKRAEAVQQKLTELPERRRQEQAEAERLRREQAEAEGLAAAESQEQERQRQVQETERLAQQRQQEAEADARCQTSSEEHLQQLHRPISRRRALQIVGFGGGGLVAAIAANSLLRSDGAISGSGPDDLSPVVVQTVLVNEKGVVTERNSGQVNAFREGLGFGVGLDMVQIPAGEFVMGSPSDEEGRINAEGPQRTVTMSSFFMGRFPVTQTQYRAVMGENPSRFQSNGDHHPVEQVSWRDAVAVCEKLSELTGREYRLPSEAEWEYACRARTQTPFYFGETITTNVVNYNGGFTYGSGSKGDYRRRTTEVGRFPPNAFGLYDMHGNVWEWCADHWHGNYNGMPTDGTAWISSNESSFRLLRGGSWYNSPNYCRSALRYNSRLDYYSINVGFRLVCLATREFL